MMNDEFCIKDVFCECLELLLVVDRSTCEDELLCEHFGPPPGSAEELIEQWEKDVFPTLDFTREGSPGAGRLPGEMEVRF